MIDFEKIEATFSAETKEEREYAKNCEEYDLKLEWLNERYKLSGVTYRLMGVRKRGRMPFLIFDNEEIDDKTSFNKYYLMNIEYFIDKMESNEIEMI